MDREIIEQPSILVVYIATGDYAEYWEGFIRTVDNFFPNERKLIMVYSDKSPFYFRIPPEVKTTSHTGLPLHVTIQHQFWPLTVLNKFRYIQGAMSLDIKGIEQVWCFDSKVEFRKEFAVPLTDDILYAFPHMAWEYDNHDCSVYTHGRGITEKSKAYIEGFDYIYSQSGVMGGSTSQMASLCEGCNDMIEKDLMHCVIPMWHDESYWNKYLVTHPDRVKYMESGYTGEIGNPKTNQDPVFNMRDTTEIQRRKQEIYNK